MKEKAASGTPSWESGLLPGVSEPLPFILLSLGGGEGKRSHRRHGWRLQGHTAGGLQSPGSTLPCTGHCDLDKRCEGKTHAGFARLAVEKKAESPINSLHVDYMLTYESDPELSII